jgi:hypothetical protein
MICRCWINPITNPNPVHSPSITWQYWLFLRCRQPCIYTGPVESEDSRPRLFLTTWRILHVLGILRYKELMLCWVRLELMHYDKLWMSGKTLVEVCHGFISLMQGFIIEWSTLLVYPEEYQSPQSCIWKVSIEFWGLLCLQCFVVYCISYVRNWTAMGKTRL